MNVLVPSSVFPNPQQPTLGVFVRERTSRIARHCAVQVVAPVPWFPLNRLIRGHRWAGIPTVESQARLRVHHPRFFSVPRYVKWLDGVLYAVSLAPFLQRLRREFPFDLIDAHFAYPDGLAAVLLGGCFACPVVITLRGSIVRLSTYRLHRPQIGFALRRAARVLAVSESLKGVAIGLGIPAEKIRVIPNGVDPARFQPGDRQQARRALGLPPHRPILLSVGGLNEGKGHHRIVALLPRLIRHRPDLLYVVVGPESPGDTSRPLIEALVHRHALHGHVLLAGPRCHDDIPLWLAASDVLCLATRSEGWANALLEALACGRPVVTTRVGGNAEIVTSESLGILVPPEDDTALENAIVAAFSRGWDADAMVRYARLRSWEATACAVLEEFEKVVRPSRAPGEAAGPAVADID